MDLQNYIASLDRVIVTLRDLKRSNLRSNQQAVDNYSNLLKYGAKALEDVFRELLREDAREPVEPLGYIMKSTCSCAISMLDSKADNLQAIPSPQSIKTSNQHSASSTRTYQIPSPKSHLRMLDRLQHKGYTQRFAAITSEIH